MPEGTKERFIQGFAPGAATGYVVLMDHSGATPASPAPSLGPPNRSVAMWSFLTTDFETVCSRAADEGVTVVQQLKRRARPFLSVGKAIIIEDPDGFPIEISEAS